MVNQPWLEVSDAVVTYGAVRAVDGVSLDVAQGEIVALLGASGSGKSSLLRAIAGLEPLAGGSIRLHGVDLTGVPTHKRGLGMMFQEGQLFAHRSVAGNIAYGLKGRPRDEVRSRVEELLELVGMSGYGDRPVTKLSGGQAQRVALARSLAPAPELLLLDEPLSALDRGLRERLVRELWDAIRSTGTTALYVTHDQSEAFAIADRVAILGEGRLWQVDRPDRLWSSPVSVEVARFLGYGPFISDALARDLGFDAPDGATVGLASDSLVAGETEVEVLDWRYRVGGVSARVRLPDGQDAELELLDPPGDHVGIRIARAVTL